MPEAWLRKQSGQAVVLVAVAVLVLTGILALALDGGGIYLDKRQLQNAADAAALAGAELLMAVPPSYTNIHNLAVGNLIKNLPGTSLAGTVCSSACPNLATIGAATGGIGTVILGAGYNLELSVTTSYTYRVTIWHAHPVAVAPIHGFQSTITLVARATAQNANLPYAVAVLQDRAQYAQYSDFNISGTPGGIVLQGGGGAVDRGGIFSNASIAPGSGAPGISFSPAGNAGDLWAYNESGADSTALNTAGRVSGQQTLGTLPRAAAHLDFPNYPEPAPPAASFIGITVSGTTYLCPGQYTNQISVPAGTTGVLLPGVFQVKANGVSVQGTLRTLSSASDTFPLTACGQTLTAMPADPGVIIEVTPSLSTSPCNANSFSAGTGSTVNLTPSPRYFNINLYIEVLPGWQTTCTTAPLGTNVVRFSGTACYSISGTIYGPADNMVLTGSGCGSGVGQVIAWTLLINGSGNVNATFDPTKVPYMKGLIQ